uniref:Anterior gradient 2, protein disulphide isomerase family member n=1 Tax=Chelydra serpentina TaxID=8475 RepID=A0A8C3SQN8_CHESE
AMEKSCISVFLLLIAVSYALVIAVCHFSLGWGDNLIWTQTYEEALFRAKTGNKPLMIIHHLEDCPHSQALKKVFAEHKEIQKLAEKFVLLNLVVNYLTSSTALPFLFPDPSLTVRADITGRYSNRLYAYEPSDISLLIAREIYRLIYSIKVPESGS